jgi:Fe-S-cluster-containing hydrogenase component 2
MNKNLLKISSFFVLGTFFIGCQQPQIICPKGTIYVKKYDVCQLTNKPLKGVVIDIKNCKHNKCEYILNDEVNDKIKIIDKKGKYKIGDIVDIILYKKPKIIKK